MITDFSKQAAQQEPRTPSDDGWKAKLARKLSGALGRKITPAQIRYVGGDRDLVMLTNREMYRLHGGNAARQAGTGTWFVNGKAAPAPEQLKPLHDRRQK